MDYLYLLEDGEFLIGNEPTEEDLEMVEASELSIINTITKEYYSAESLKWEPIEEVKD